MKRTRHPKAEALDEVILEIRLDANCSFFVECLAEQIVNRAASSVELRNSIRQAVESLHFGEPRPAVVRLQLVRDEMMRV